jgi:hypothetical protein
MFSAITVAELCACSVQELELILGAKKRGAAFIQMDTNPLKGEAEDYAIFCEKKGAAILLPKRGKKLSDKSMRQVMIDVLQAHRGEKILRNDLCWECHIEYHKRNGKKISECGDPKVIEIAKKTIGAKLQSGFYTKPIKSVVQIIALADGYWQIPE